MMHWFEIANTRNILTPALLLYVDRIADNIDSMIEISGSPDRLRPHVKTYKMPEIVQMQIDKGINKFKCATLTEAEMLAAIGVKDILLAMPLVGSAQTGLLRLMRKFPRAHFSTLIDNQIQVDHWVNTLQTHSEIAFFLDINVGMNRTGIIPEKALNLLNNLQPKPQFHFKGLHIYDGHIGEGNLLKRKDLCNESFREVDGLLKRINQPGLEIVCGGSVTFSIHAKHKKRTLSPGTTLLWDAGNASKFPDIPIKNAAVLLTTVISKPAKNTICLDLGHKAVASEMQGERAHFPQITNARRIGHSEEHLVLELDDSNQIEVGAILYAIPWHICPTVALHEEVLIVKEQEVIDQWKVAARRRTYLV